MEGKVKAGWFVIGLAAGCVPGIVVGIIVGMMISAYFVFTTPMVDEPIDETVVDESLVDESLNGGGRDVGKSLHEFGRPAMWNATHKALGDTGFVAGAGPTRYTDEDNQDWDYYSIDVEWPEDDAFYVFFERDFRIDEIPVEVLERSVKDIITFDEATRAVIFTVGERIETYTLPDR